MHVATKKLVTQRAACPIPMLLAELRVRILAREANTCALRLSFRKCGTNFRLGMAASLYTFLLCPNGETSTRSRLFAPLWLAQFRCQKEGESRGVGGGSGSSGVKDRIGYLVFREVPRRHAAAFSVRMLLGACVYVHKRNGNGNMVHSLRPECHACRGSGSSAAVSELPAALEEFLTLVDAGIAAKINVPSQGTSD
jgi:hypothetical protein